MSRIIPDAEELPGQYYQHPAPHAIANQPTNYTSQLQPYSIPHMQQQGNLRSSTVPHTTPSNYQYQQQHIISQTLPAIPTHQPLPTMPTHQVLPTMPTHQTTSVSPYSLPVGAHMEQRDEFNSLIQEIVNELSKDGKVVPELRFIFSDKFTSQEMDKLPDVQSFISKLMEKGLLSEHNVMYLEDYLRETPYDHLSKKLQKFSQSSDSAMRSVQPSVPKQGQVPQRAEERPISQPQTQPQTQPQPQSQLVHPFPRPPSEAAIYYYPMDRRPHGVCAIFNIQNFTTDALGRRKGSDIDRDRLQLMFQHLKYNVEVYNDLTADKLTSTLDEISQRDHNNFDSFICCILTHGADNDALYGSDGKQVNIRKIMSLFYGNKARSLFGKPKIFFIQACRGDLEDTGSEDKSFGKKNILMEDAEQVHQEYHFDSIDLPDTADFLIAFPTSSGYVSWRSHNEGTWYIKALCEQLQQCHEQYDLMTILTMVNGQVALKKTSEGYKQMPAPVTHLRKLVYIRS